MGPSEIVDPELLQKAFLEVEMGENAGITKLLERLAMSRFTGSLTVDYDKGAPFRAELRHSLENSELLSK
jgi:hypothetical protein